VALPGDYGRIIPWLRSKFPSGSAGSSQREWLTLRGSNNPFAASGGPVPQITIPLEARITDRGISVEILRLGFNLKIGNTLVGQGEIGPYAYLGTEPTYLPVTATCPQSALSHLLNPEPPQGRITLTIALRGLLRYRHSFTEPDDALNVLSDMGFGLGDPDIWHVASIGGQGLTELDVQVARSDWYEQVVQQLGVGSYLIAPLYLPYGVPSWESTLGHMDAALRFPATRPRSSPP
jgi:hypothetical protein